MRRLISTGVVVCAVLLLCQACGDDETTSPVGDTTAPAAVTDLDMTDSIGTVLHLQWTATGDDDTSGTAASYQVRLADEPLTEDNWDDAGIVASAPTPLPSGTVQTLEIGTLAWWTRYYVGVRVIDDAGNTSAISNIAAGTPYPDANYRLLVDTRLGIVEVGVYGDSEILIPSSKWVEVRGDRIYTGATAIWEYDLSGEHTRTIPKPANITHYGFAVLPGDRYALLSNSKDTVYFIDGAGSLLAAAAMLPAPGENLQMTHAVVVGDQLIICDDGENHVLAANLNTYQIRVFKDLTSLDGWLGGIDYADGRYCICQSRSIWSFAETGAPELIATMPEGNITGAVMLGGHTWVIINFTGELYRVNNSTGEIVLVADGLDYPGDIEMIVRPEE